MWAGGTDREWRPNATTGPDRIMRSRPKWTLLEDEAGIEPSETVMSVPHDLVPKVRELIAKATRLNGYGYIRPMATNRICDDTANSTTNISAGSGPFR